MQLSGISNSYGSSGVERTLTSLVSQTSGGSHKAGQVLPGADGDRGGPPPPPPPRSSSQASSQFAANTLASLLSVQQQPSASDFASKLIGQVDADGDGSLSLDEIRSTLEKAGLTKTSAAAAAGEDFMSSAFGKLDGNRDGKLDTSELTSALEEMMKSHHGHRHGPPPAPPQDMASASGASATASTVVETASAASAS